jgi:hypothetical protein
MVKAVMPLVRGGSTVTVGAVTYPDPALFTVIDVTLPPEITAVAVAVTPDGGA